MENQAIQAELVGSSTKKSNKKRGCCLICVGIGAVCLMLLVFLIILGLRVDEERVSRLGAMMEAIAEGNAEDAHEFFAKQHREKFTTEDVEAFINENNLQDHTACEWKLGEEDAQGNRIYNGYVTLQDGSQKILYAPVVHEDDKWSVVALLTEKPEKPEIPKTEETDDGVLTWGFSFSTATLKNVRLTAEDSASAHDQSEFPDDIDELFCLADIDWAPSGTEVECKWYYLGPDGNAPESELGSKPLVTTQSSMELRFNVFRKSQVFRQGHYRVVLYVDGKEQSRKGFVIRKPTVKEMQKRAESGDAFSLFRLGVAYIVGTEVAADPGKGVQYVKQAAEAGLPAAQYKYGVELLRGKRLAKDQTEAVKWIRKAAEQGDMDAQYDLGVFYREGTGVPTNITEAIIWTRKSAEQGDELAQCNLGLHYKLGVGVTQDFAEAAKWLELATQQGNAQAMFLLGELYENGDGLKKDMEEAIRLYRKSAAQGYEPSKAILRRLGEQGPN